MHNRCFYQHTTRCTLPRDNRGDRTYTKIKASPLIAIAIKR